ncbi:hypothetical protein MTR67_042898 [Solanum verrucosum]|uniref:Reverse transcriptase Ty1/copia-type domain-containing protein n=1 Tax=Solanum verrucosum TaxID=315347 RepID=A0AAF0UQA5_SOLVR|nr:hypothetical protein MTR67_042898 [Solanum verrucosum]
MHEELVALEENDTWDMVDTPTNATIIGSRWVYSIKMKADGSLDRYKARLVAQGYRQEYGIDYDEKFAPIAKMTTIRIFLALASIKGWKLHQLDIKNAFMHGDLQEVVYMKTPQGNDKVGISHLKDLLHSSFKMKDLGKLTYFLGLEVLSQFVTKPYKMHYTALLRVIRYIKCTMNWSLLFPSSSSLDMVGYGGICCRGLGRMP